MPDTGRLLVCATPIGNLGDVTFRVLDALREADTIAAEDTRVTSKLLARYDIQTRMERFDEHTAAQRTPVLVERMLAGELIALVSDAGTPGVSDPGAQLVAACVEAGVPIEALPGASALLAAVTASGLPMQPLYFGGFFPRKAGERKAVLEKLADLDATLVFFESPKRMAAALSAVAAVLPDRTAAVARELTKLHEEVMRGPVAELAELVAGRVLKGEAVLLIGPPVPHELQFDAEELRGEVEAIVATGCTRKDAIKQVSERSGVPRNDVYASVHGPKTVYGRDD
ncbi:MAG: 16S rRNA (cytidine(1402)-2'-O)-methyltransferase [Actinobacteria bacterium]|nr:16S rRNA (cytidine(1402)-2'-O)-methyltransferase [Actinomycetota bacterium]MCG2806671.1 16S rRNA (cytidine(1402)-2'-O)-methyltransferase [Coriobacteriia bacterium]